MEELKLGRLDGKTCVITGASSGIGAKAAEIFAREGAKLVIAARRTDLLNTVAEKIRASGGEVHVVTTDISVIEQAEALIAKAVEIFGTIDVLVNNAGEAEPGLHPIDAFTDAEMERIVGINLKGTMYVTRAATKVFGAQGTGNIVNVSSVSGVTGCGAAVYTATKGGLISLTKHIALRYATTKPYIRANCVCPGSVWTDITRTELEAQKSYIPEANAFNDAVNQHSSAGVGISRSIDVANVLLFLASDESICVNGQIITIDCGCNL